MEDGPGLQRAFASPISLRNCSAVCEDLIFWIGTDRNTALRALELVEAVMRDPFIGIGKPEPLKRELADAWSRRLTREHRVVYRAGDTKIVFLQARYHY
ncbi:MAG TPA: Txe/YoeB family addiction module toxin [Bryobacteraceae bacterium]|nr:Txe/YoeB family addiction module toxin [Bryobacteraceae bacterium]